MKKKIFQTVLLNEMAGYHSEKSRAALDMIRSIVHDTVFDIVEYRNWLDNLGGMNADKQIIASYIGEGDFANALIMLDMLPSLYGLVGENLDDYNDYKQLTLWQMNLDQQGRTFFELDSTEMVMLESFAEKDNNAGSMAMGILEFAHGYNYCNCLPVNDSSGLKSSPVEIFSRATEGGLYVEAVPNPAKSWVAFNFALPSFVIEAVLEITDVNGNRVALFDVGQGFKQKVWDIRKVKPGVCVYSLRYGSVAKSGKLIIK